MRRKQSYNYINYIPGYSQCRILIGNFVRDRLDQAGRRPSDMVDNIVLAAGRPGWYDRDHLSVDKLNLIYAYQDYRIDLKTLIALRRLFQEPIDCIMGVEVFQAISGGLSVVRAVRRISQTDLSAKVHTTRPLIARIEALSTWAADNRAGSIETPAQEIWNRLADLCGIYLLTQLRDILAANIDDILGLS